MFTRNKYDPPTSSPRTKAYPKTNSFPSHRLIGWASVIFSLQNWLAETPAQKSAASSPAYMSIGMSVMAMGVVRCFSFSPLSILFRSFPSCGRGDFNLLSRDTCLTSYLQDEEALEVCPPVEPRLRLHRLYNGTSKVCIQCSYRN